MARPGFILYINDALFDYLDRSVVLENAREGDNVHVDGPPRFARLTASLRVYRFSGPSPFSSSSVIIITSGSSIGEARRGRRNTYIRSPVSRTPVAAVVVAATPAPSAVQVEAEGEQMSRRRWRGGKGRRRGEDGGEMGRRPDVEDAGVGGKRCRDKRGLRARFSPDDSTMPESEEWRLTCRWVKQFAVCSFISDQSGIYIFTRK